MNDIAAVFAVYKMEIILLSAVVVCVVSKTFCGIGLSGLFGGEHESVHAEDTVISGNSSADTVSKNKTAGMVWLISGLFIFLAWVITVILIGR